MGDSGDATSASPSSAPAPNSAFAFPALDGESMEIEMLTRFYNNNERSLCSFFLIIIGGKVRVVDKRRRA